MTWQKCCWTMAQIPMKNFKYIKLFVEYNADVNYVKFELTPLDKAYFTNNDEIINYLIANGAKTYEEIKGEQDNSFMYGILSSCKEWRNVCKKFVAKNEKKY